jgi:hypothetical protein
MNTKLILAALMMSLSLAACGQKDQAPDATTEPAPPADTAPPADQPMDSTTPPAEEGMPPADSTTPPAEGDAAEPAPAQ